MAVMDRGVPRAGFVLVGGKSSRMGRDKAALPFRGRTLLEHIAAAVAEAAGSVTLVGAPERYRGLDLPVIPDSQSGMGPLAGIHTALSASHAAWNLIVACDLPSVSGPFLKMLMETAEASGSDCLIPTSPSGYPEPLCAAYHGRCRETIGEALRRGIRKVTEGLAGLKVISWNVPEASWFRNVNTPEDWTSYLNG